MVTEIAQVVPKQQELPTELQGITFAWLEVTRSCTLTCKHCYVASMPGLGHGKMQYADWVRVLKQLKEAGCCNIQFIGENQQFTPPSANC